MNPFVLILASGGIDSTSCINFYKKMNFDIEAIFIDYGQNAITQEKKAIKSITKFYNIKLNILKLTTNNAKNGEIMGRNAFLIFTALMNFPRKEGILSIGIHAGTPYYDCSKKFFLKLEEIVDNYSSSLIKLNAPFLNFNKREIYEYSITEKIPIEKCYSCEQGGNQPCGKCPTCKDLEIIYASKNKQI